MNQLVRTASAVFVMLLLFIPVSAYNVSEVSESFISPESGASFGYALSFVGNILGANGLNFMLTFTLIFFVVWFLFSMVGKTIYKDSKAFARISVPISIILGLAGSGFVYFQEINVMEFVGAYSLILLAVFGIIMTVNAFFVMLNKELKTCGKLLYFGVIALAIGFLFDLLGYKLLISGAISDVLIFMGIILMIVGIICFILSAFKGKKFKSLGSDFSKRGGKPPESEQEKPGKEQLAGQPETHRQQEPPEKTKPEPAVSAEKEESEGNIGEQPGQGQEEPQPEQQEPEEDLPEFEEVEDEEELEKPKLKPSFVGRKKRLCNKYIKYLDRVLDELEKITIKELNNRIQNYYLKPEFKKAKDRFDKLNIKDLFTVVRRAISHFERLRAKSIYKERSFLHQYYFRSFTKKLKSETEKAFNKILEAKGNEKKQEIAYNEELFKLRNKMEKEASKYKTESINFLKSFGIYYKKTYFSVIAAFNFYKIFSEAHKKTKEFLDFSSKELYKKQRGSQPYFTKLVSIINYLKKNNKDLIVNLSDFSDKQIAKIEMNSKKFSNESISKKITELKKALSSDLKNIGDLSSADRKEKENIIRNYLDIISTLSLGPLKLCYYVERTLLTYSADNARAACENYDGYFNVILKYLGEGSTIFKINRGRLMKLMDEEIDLIEKFGK